MADARHAALSGPIDLAACAFEDAGEQLAAVRSCSFFEPVDVEGLQELGVL